MKPRNPHNRLASIGRVFLMIAPLAFFTVPEFAWADAGGQAADAFGKIEAAVRGTAGGLEGIGVKLWLYLSLIAFTWQAGQFVLEGGDITQTFGGTIRAVFLIGLTYWFITPSNGEFGIQPGRLPLVWFVDDMSQKVAAAILGSGDGSLRDVAGAAFQNFYGAVNKVSQVMSKTFGDATGVWERLGALLSNWVMFMELGAAMVILLLAGIVFFVMATIGLFMFQVGAIVAPLFIPWMVLEKTSWVFDGWLKFILGAAMYRVAGAAIVKMGNGVLTGVLAHMMVNTQNYGEIMLSAMLMPSVALALAFIMLQLTGIANGLLSGNAAFNMAKLTSSLGKAGMLTSGAAAAGAGGLTSAAGKGLTTAANTTVGEAGKAVVSAVKQPITAAANRVSSAISSAKATASQGVGAVAKGALSGARSGLNSGAASLGGGMRNVGDKLQDVGSGMMNKGRKP